jgi:hypothetical protein
MSFLVVHDLLTFQGLGAEPPCVALMVVPRGSFAWLASAYLPCHSIAGPATSAWPAAEWAAR